MGLTGLVWLGFVLAHMAGNMLIFVSADLYNAYGHALISNKPLIYIAESVLVLSIIIHIYTAITLTIQNRKSRQSRYALVPNGEKGPAKASQTMAIQGSMILAFIILHLITFKYGTVYTTIVGGTEMRDLHRLVIEVFNQPAYVAWYAVCLVLLMFHLSHGAHSIFQSFGILERKMQASLKKYAWIYAAVVAGGFLSQPLYVFLIHK
jgi:succinate dehydrogenase / fumarate reductase cytochrome b subunit